MLFGGHYLEGSCTYFLTLVIVDPEITNCRIDRMCPLSRTRNSLEIWPQNLRDALQTILNFAAGHWTHPILARDWSGSYEEATNKLMLDDHFANHDDNFCHIFHITIFNYHTDGWWSFSIYQQPFWAAAMFTSETPKLLRMEEILHHLGWLKA